MMGYKADDRRYRMTNSYTIGVNVCTTVNKGEVE